MLTKIMEPSTGSMLKLMALCLKRFYNQVWQSSEGLRLSKIFEPWRGVCWNWKKTNKQTKRQNKNKTKNKTKQNKTKTKQNKTKQNKTKTAFIDNWLFTVIRCEKLVSLKGQKYMMGCACWNSTRKGWTFHPPPHDKVRDSSRVWLPKGWKNKNDQNMSKTCFLDWNLV